MNKIIIADRYTTLESVKPDKDCKVCDHLNDYVCFEHEVQTIKKSYPNAQYTNDCEWVIDEKDWNLA